MYAQFSEGETTRAAYDTFEGYARRHKLPLALYVDRDSIYRTEREATVAEQLAGQEPLTQFGRAMKGLGVAIELAYSAQAKGGAMGCCRTAWSRNCVWLGSAICQGQILFCTRSFCRISTVGFGLSLPSKPMRTDRYRAI
jgi:hypothetical protein